jgi:peroxiredoxin
MCVFLLATISLYAQMPEANSSTIYKDTAGKVISKDQFEKLEKQSEGQLRKKPVIEKGIVKEMALRKATENELAFFKKMNDRITQYSKDWEGKKAPDFVGKDLDDNEISLSKLQGKVVVLKFWFTACRPCKEEMPALNKMIEKKYKNNKNVVFLAPCLDGKDATKKTLIEHPFRFTSLYSAGSISKSYGVFAYPTHIIIDKNGIINYANLTEGEGTQPLERAIDKALSGKDH